MPMRTLTKSLPSLPMMERRPLCPPAPPPTLTRTVARFQVEVVVDDDEVLRPVVRDGGAGVVHERRRLEERGVVEA